ncbi:hypothetical protein L7F22_031911 [Adiantum nelumboides]|nr:hypothetical protein [Adiantum nelumboides]
MDDRPEDVTEEVSSSQGKQTHEVGESSRPPQSDDDIFKTQLVTAVAMFSQVMQNPSYVGGKNVDNKLSRVELKWKLMKFYTLNLADAQPPAVTVNPTKDSELIVFGGEHNNGNKTFVYNDLYRYNAEKDQWKHVSSPNSPPPRSAHQAVGWKNSVFVFGGEFASPNQERFHHYKDLWRFDLATNTWEQLLLKGCPSPRSGHRMVLYKHKIILFGGFYDTLREVRYFNDMYVLDLDKYKWQEIKPKLGMQWPSPRSGFQFSVHLDEVFLYGGYFKDHGSEKDTSEKGVVHADLWMLDPRSWEWSKVKKQGMPPGARAGFSMCTHKRRAILFGGVVDTEAEGSSFMYPLELRKGKLPKQKTKGKASIASDHGQLLETGNGKSFDVNHSGETVNKQVSLPSSIDAGCADMDVQSSRCYQNLASQMEETELDDTEMDDENSTESAERSASMMHIPSTSAAIQQVVKPCGRINGCMVVGRDTLYLYGGLMEVGDQEITLDDLYTLDLNKLDEWRYLIEASKAEWVDLHQEEEADDESDSGSASDTDADSSGDEGDGEFQDTKSGTLSAAQETAALLRGAGKKMLRKERKSKIENLRSALGLADLQRTPKPGETLKDFFVRTNEYWQLAAYQHTQHTGKELRKDGFDLAEGHYRELKPVLDELAKLEAEQKEEEEEDTNTLKSKKAKEKARHANNYR